MLGRTFPLFIVVDWSLDWAWNLHCLRLLDLSLIWRQNDIRKRERVEIISGNLRRKLNKMGLTRDRNLTYEEGYEVPGIITSQ